MFQPLATLFRVRMRDCDCAVSAGELRRAWLYHCLWVLVSDEVLVLRPSMASRRSSQARRRAVFSTSGASGIDFFAVVRMKPTPPGDTSTRLLMLTV